MIELFDHSDDRAKIFDYYRDLEAKSDSPLASNYNTKNFILSEQSILSYYKKDIDSDPSTFSTIYRRNWWPQGCYRIINRMWQYPRNKKIKGDVGQHVYHMIQSQIHWCLEQEDFRLAFISRQNVNRLYDRFIIGLDKLNLSFEKGPKIWVCKGSSQDCFQNILYYGDSSILDNWYTK